MYQDEEKGFVLTDVILQLLFLVMFIFILIWLFPTKGFIKNNLNDPSGTAIAVNESIYQSIFRDNLISMKEASIHYYTTPRLPRNTGDKVSMTLSEMLEKKLILPFQDKNGDSCSLDESYVEITKLADEYQLKVMLSCPNESEYLIVHLGCYDYCENDVCEKTNDDRAIAGTTTGNTTSSKPIVTPPVIERPIYNNNITINNCIDCNRVEPPKVYYCKYVDGKYYGKNGTIVSEETYRSECEPPKVYYCKYVDGKYYGKNGTVVSKTTYEQECVKPEKQLYYEYRTKTLVTEKVSTKMCTYHPITEEGENIYTLPYTSSAARDIPRYPYGLKLPAGATNIKIEKIWKGQDNFSLSGWKNLVLDGRIYNYERGYVKTTPTVTSSAFQSAGLSSRHIVDVEILKTKAVTYSNYVEYRIDYHILMDRPAIFNDYRVTTFRDSVAGDIYYVPVRFYITYDLESSKTKTKECSRLSDKELDHVVRRYTDYDTLKKYEYGPKKWTLNPNLSGVEYTGKKEWR